MSIGGYKIRDPVATHFLTFAVFNWIDVFTRQTYRDIVVDSLKYCQREKELKLNAWCLMSNHVKGMKDLNFGKTTDSGAASKIRLMPGIRWQVFKRDNWTCCGCNVRVVEADTVILHVDHINPRSKEGRDEIDNYQTLCEKCNIGKSNKDNIDLRKR